MSAPADEFLVGADVMSPFVAARRRAEFLLETLIHDVGTRAATRERVKALLDQLDTMVRERPPAGLDGFEPVDGCQRTLGSPRWRTAKVPAGGHGFSPLADTRIPRGLRWVG